MLERRVCLCVCECVCVCAAGTAQEHGVADYRELIRPRAGERKDEPTGHPELHGGGRPCFLSPETGRGGPGEEGGLCTQSRPTEVAILMDEHFVPPSGKEKRYDIDIS